MLPSEIFVSLYRWFLESAEVYNPIVMVQLICCSILMSISVFYLDMVLPKFSINHFITLFNKNNHFFFELDNSVFMICIAANSSHWFFCDDCFDVGFSWHFDSFHLLLLWTVGHWKFRENGRMFVLWFKLARALHWITKVFTHNDCEYAKAYLLLWIWIRSIRFANFYQCKIYLSVMHKCSIVKCFTRF